MIPRAHVTHWRARAPWPTDAQVEQDLVLSRALVELFSDPGIAQALAFRGGTALHKLFFEAPGRYSEDIDLVQRTSAAIGPTFDAIRARLDPWLGEARSKQGEGRASLVYRFESTSMPVQRMRLKVEINTREHFTVLGAHTVPFAVESPWFAGEAKLATFGLEELLGTKLRALYQRKKGRDLYDLWLTLSNTSIDDVKVVACFEHYLAHSGAFVARADFESNLERKIMDRSFTEDVGPLLADPSTYDVTRAAQLVLDRLIAKLSPDPRRSPGAAN
ncbi:MAG: nucleotidyl transferase AbiEii/AbiGii toxin family protein [Planctomycetota bacterium]|nr:nucleotidyl transferase AbiEii/AbiGii toxin family protein [Planctomycetota bacterium]